MKPKKILNFLCPYCNCGFSTNKKRKIYCPICKCYFFFNDYIERRNCKK